MSDPSSTPVSDNANPYVGDQDRRGSRRRPSSAKLRLRLSSGVHFDASMVDISATGVQIELPRVEDAPIEGKRLILELVDDGADTAPPRAGEVIWSGAPDSPRLGVQFLNDESIDLDPGQPDLGLDIERVKVDPQVAMRFPAARARRWQVLPFAANEDCVMVAAADAILDRAGPALDRCYRREVEVHVVEPEALSRVIERVYAGAEALGASADYSSSVDIGSSIDTVSIDINEPDAVTLYDHLFASAIMYGASDIHIDSFEEAVRLRVRVDGQIEPLRELSPESGAALISRIKVMAGLNIAERRAPQDGRLRHETANGVKVDVRVATLPTKHGERLTLRLLAQDSGNITLASLGMSEDQLKQFGQAIRQPYGLILITGPTGSGKSTTLYAAIRQLLREADLNVITIEDPIEYQIPEATQVEVDPAEKVTFPKALRSTLRHDPDVVMVGEIRDNATADIAVKAALTGHLVFSTLHTNDAAGAITRLTDMGVPPFLVAATVRMVVAQRLVRQLCSSCSQDQPCDPAHAAALGRPSLAEQTIKSPAGCLYCGDRGYTGRMALFEMIKCDKELSKLIVNDATEAEIKEHLDTLGLSTLADDAAAKLLDGRTSMAEVLRNVVSFAEFTAAPTQALNANSLEPLNDTTADNTASHPLADSFSEEIDPVGEGEAG
ncbi:MAG: ATPase, T2SS/T4P/T4SS family [Planctomycetota bacterium]